jgi:hypothetical protein
MTSPRIVGHEWGRVDVEGQGSFKDVALFPGGAREWDWGATGTRHTPGVQPADVVALVAHGATVVVLSRGVLQHLQVQDVTVEWLRSRGVAVHVLQTDEAIARYNELCAAHEPVGALIHSTC